MLVLREDNFPHFKKPGLIASRGPIRVIAENVPEGYGMLAKDRSSEVSFWRTLAYSSITVTIPLN